jgi:hypothetical protein
VDSIRVWRIDKGEEEEKEEKDYVL